MAYYFMVNTKKDTYVPLDISKSSLFERTSRFKGAKYSIEEIDRFTTNFQNINFLIKHLIETEILDENTFNKPLSIRLPQKGGNPKKVMYDFLYQRDRKYLDNPSLLVRDIRRMQVYGDFNFCLEYVLHFFNTYDCRDIAPELRYFFERSLREGIADNRLYESDENGDIPLVRMTKQLIYSCVHNYGEVTYDYNTLNYRNLHDVIAFCEHYRNKRLENEITESKGKVKTLKKEEKQISFDEEK